MPQERRRTPRYPFIADAEVHDDASGTTVKTRIRELSLFGCYVDMDNPLPTGTPITIKINTAGGSLRSPGKNGYSTPQHLTCGRGTGSGIRVAVLVLSVQSRIVVKEWRRSGRRGEDRPRA